jgi:hypothetical protein
VLKNKTKELVLLDFVKIKSIAFFNVELYYNTNLEHILNNFNGPGCNEQNLFLYNCKFLEMLRH